MKLNCLNDEERQHWVENDETLYQMWRQARQGITVWIRKNRELIDDHIKAIRNRQPTRFNR